MHLINAQTPNDNTSSSGQLIELKTYWWTVYFFFSCKSGWHGQECSMPEVVFSGGYPYHYGVAIRYMYARNLRRFLVAEELFRLRHKPHRNGESLGKLFLLLTFFLNFGICLENRCLISQPNVTHGVVFSCISVSCRDAPRRIIYAMPVNHEFDLVEAKVNELGSDVDVFLLLESNYTAAGSTSFLSR